MGTSGLGVKDWTPKVPCRRCGERLERAAFRARRGRRRTCSDCVDERADRKASARHYGRPPVGERLFDGFVLLKRDGQFGGGYDHLFDGHRAPELSDEETFDPEL